MADRGMYCRGYKNLQSATTRFDHHWLKEVDLVEFSNDALEPVHLIDAILFNDAQTGLFLQRPFIFSIHHSLSARAQAAH